MARHFWEGQIDPEADLSESRAYLRPLEPGEFAQEVFDSLKPAGPTPKTPKERPFSLLREHQLEPEEFARQALENPEMWDRLDHQYLQDVLEGAEINEDLERLAEDWLSGRAEERARLAAGALPAIPPEEEDLGGPGEGFDDHVDEFDEDVEAIPVAMLATDDGFKLVDEPLDLSKVDEWWKKK